MRVKLAANAWRDRMKERLKRLTALLLVLSMTLSLLTTSGWAAEVSQGDSSDTVWTEETEETEEPTTSEETEEPSETEPVEEPAPEEQPEEPVEEEAPVTPEETPEEAPQEELEEEAPVKAETEEEAPLDQAADAWAQYTVSSEKKLSLSYDDRYTFSVSGYSVVAVETESVTSYQVSGGAVTKTLDEEVLTWSEGSNKVIATGVGTAKVLLAKSGSTSDAIQYNVTVKPATLTVMFLAGQSNMEGYCASNTGYQTEYSIASQEGQVYSTYIPSDSTKAVSVTGLSGMSNYYLSTKTGSAVSSEASFAPEALNSAVNQAVDGTKLVYPLNALTTAGSGKTGPDSALAYEWNQLTGDKVWTINAAWGGTTISGWMRGSTYFKRASALFTSAMNTLEAEKKAGHFTESKRLMFWLQGEYDMKTTLSAYMDSFTSMYLGKNGQPGLRASFDIDAAGIIMTRALNNSYGADYQTAADLAMSGARIAQYLIANSSEFPDVYLVSNSNEEWVTDSCVASYFKSAYSGGKFTYPTHGKTPALPKTVAEVHYDIHYSQVGHNENGLTAASTLYQILNGATGTTTVRWMDEDGASISEAYCTVDGTSTLIANVKPLSVPKKGLTYTVKDTSIVTYDATTGQLKGLKKGSTTLTVSDGTTPLGSINVRVYTIDSPRVTSTSVVTAKKTGVTVKWSKVSGASVYGVYRLTGSTGATGSNKWSKIGTTTSTSYVDTTAKSGKTYTYTVRCLNSSGAATSGYYHFGEEGSGASYTIASGGLKLAWGAVDGAAGYQIYRNGKKLTTVTKTSYTDKTATGNGTNYIYTIYPYDSSKKICGLCTTVISYYVKAPTISTAKSKAKKKLTVTWKKNAKATGYQIQYSTNKNFSSYKTANVSSYKTLSKTISGLKSKKKYYVRVRAFKKVSGTKYYSVWSKTLNATVK